MIGILVLRRQDQRRIVILSTEYEFAFYSQTYKAGIWVLDLDEEKPNESLSDLSHNHTFIREFEPPGLRTAWLRPLQSIRASCSWGIFAIPDPYIGICQSAGLTGANNNPLTSMFA